MDLPEARPIEPIPREDDVLLINPLMYYRILHFDGRKAPQKMQTVVFAIRKNAGGPVWSVRDFDYHTDAEAFADLVRTAGGKVDSVEETTL